MSAVSNTPTPALYLRHFDDVGDVQVGCDGGEAFSNQVRLICFLPA